MAALKTVPLTFHYALKGAAAKERPWIVFTHHFGGNSTTSQRHVNVLTAFGFDCVTFNFSWHGNGSNLFRWPLSFNLMSRWSYETEKVLDQLGLEFGRRQKILFSFSGPAASALQAISRRFSKNDIAGFICDSGPFIDPKFCTRLMIEQVYGITQPLKRELTLNLMMLMWGAHHNEKLASSIEAISQHIPGFPILSFRGIKDTIVPIEKIRMALDNKGFKDLTSIDLDCGHLTGLRDQTEIYKEDLVRFLEPWMKERRPN